MKERKKLSALQIKVWKERLLLCVLSGILLLVICLPVKQKESADLMAGELDRTAVAGEYADGSLTAGAGRTEKAGAEAGGESTGRAADTGEGGGSGETEDYVARLEKRLAKTLSCMDGVGAVKVMITLADGGEAVVEKDMPNSRNIVSEQDSTGGSRSTNEYESRETTIYATEQGGAQTPYVVSRREPQIAGIVVVAQGGADAQTVRNITGAIQALFGVEAHKIKVVKMTSSESKERSR